MKFVLNFIDGEFTRVFCENKDFVHFGTKGRDRLLVVFAVLVTIISEMVSLKT